jgi:hypothetical protein
MTCRPTSPLLRPTVRPIFVGLDRPELERGK